MLYNYKGYTIDIPDNIFWDLSDQEFNEYIETKLIETFTCKDPFPPASDSDLIEE